MKKTNTIISDWLEKNGDPLIEAYVKKNLAIAEKIRLAIREKGWDYNRFLKELGTKNPDMITGTLGMINFTLKDLVQIERVLNIKLLCDEQT